MYDEMLGFVQSEQHGHRDRDLVKKMTMNKHLMNELKHQ